MNDSRLLASVRPWIERRLGVPLSAAGAGPVPVESAGPQRADALPLWAVRMGDSAIVSARPAWVEQLRAIVSDLHPDLLFSYFGAYEMARVTLPDGVGVWGPSWYLFADEASWRPAGEDLPVQLSLSDLAGLDHSVLWHCHPDRSVASFGIIEEERLVALATVQDAGDPVMNIGMEVVPDAKGRGLGRAVVSAAGRWILENGKLVLATTAAFNVPSGRTLRSLGLRYLFSDMEGVEGPFEVPPQPLGSPYAGAELYNRYPGWAMNQVIRPKPGSKEC